MGSINLAAFVHYNNNIPYFDFDDFRETVFTATVGLNRVLDEGIPHLPLEEQRIQVAKYRQIGLGIMGLATMLIKMGIRYGSQDSLDLCEEIARTMIEQATYASATLAVAEGPYPACDISAIERSPFFQTVLSPQTQKIVRENGMRNSALLTVAPTGSLATMLDISGGIEPLFALSYTRKTESLYNSDKYYKVFPPEVKEYMQEHNLKDESQLPDYFITAHHLNYHERIKMQAVWQRYIDASISSTVNLPEEATVEDIEQLYYEAWTNGLKGITVFRNNCKRVGILTSDEDSGNKEKEQETETASKSELKWGDTIECSDDVHGYKTKITTGCGTNHIQVFVDDEGRMVECFFDKGSAGSCERLMQLASRLTSLCLRSGVPLERVIDQMLSVPPCPAYVSRKTKYNDTSPGSSCPSAIGFALKRLNSKVQAEKNEASKCQCTAKKMDKISEKHKNTKQVPEINNELTICPSCHEHSLIFTNGCKQCIACGYTACD